MFRMHTPKSHAAVAAPTDPEGRVTRHAPHDAALSALVARWLGTLALVGAVLAGERPAAADVTSGPQRLWLPFDTFAPAGTPARVRVVPELSDSVRTVIDVHVAGAWVTRVIGPDQRTYAAIDVPGLAADMGITGAPDLPTLKFDLAVASSAESVTVTAQNVVVRALDPADLDPAFQGWRPLPRYIPGLDDSIGTPNRFTLDAQIYAGSGSWPAAMSPARLPLAARALGVVRNARVRLALVRWDRTANELAVHTDLRVTLNTPGQVGVQPLSREKSRFAAARFINWVELAPVFPRFPRYDAYYLIVAPSSYMDDLDPLADQKRARGYRVSTVTVESTTGTCNSIRSAIEAWYAGTPASADHYCLLVGDTDDIPLCTSPTGDPTDDLYASMDGDDLEDEVYVGRLSVDDAADCARQVDNLLGYEDRILLGARYGEVSLVAHMEDAPGKYTEAHESVRTATYAVTPDFTTYYGYQAGVTDSDVRAAINGGEGLVAYRGHGSSGAWTSWNLLYESFDATDVNALTNASLQPIVWGIACSNAALDTEDSIAEVWMERSNAGAVSYYGATVPSFTDQNHELDRQLFQAVYTQGLTKQSQAIAWAEARMASIVGDDNAWMYLLLGDPDLSIRRQTFGTLPVLVELPSLLHRPNDGSPLELSVRVRDAVGQPLPDALVTLYKRAGVAAASAGGGVPEVFENGYADAQGRITFGLSGVTDGWIQVRTRDADDAMHADSVYVTGTADAGDAPGSELAFSARPSVTRSGTRLSFGTVLPMDSRVDLFDVSGRMVRSLEAAAGHDGVTWDGRDASGSRVGEGLYFARLSCGARVTSTRIVVTR